MVALFAICFAELHALALVYPSVVTHCPIPLHVALYLFYISVPGIADRLESNLKFKQKYMDMSQKTVQSMISSHLKKIKSKKKRKKMEKDLILVGIHVR